MENLGKNEVRLLGHVDGVPALSHQTGELRFWSLPFAVKRRSGAVDCLEVLVEERRLLELNVDSPGFQVKGQVRSYNNKSGRGSKLKISVLALEISPWEGTEDENQVELQGVLCKEPIYRKTPLGREICDLMLAVPRHYGRADYLPCIAWGVGARMSSEFQVGERVALTGRLQSRTYIKYIEEQPVERVAFEISAASVEKITE